MNQLYSLYIGPIRVSVLSTYYIAISYTAYKQFLQLFFFAWPDQLLVTLCDITNIYINILYKNVTTGSATM